MTLARVKDKKGLVANWNSDLTFQKGHGWIYGLAKDV
jgi:hypothetical protein